MYVPEIIPEEDRESLIKEGGYGGEIEFGDHVAIIVVDMTREFVEDKYPSGNAETGKPAARSIADLAEKGSKHGIRSYYSRATSGNSPIKRGRWKDTAGEKKNGPKATQLVDELSPTEKDIVFKKAKPSAFFGTQLESMLNYENIDTLIVTGMTTSGCVRATVIDAFSYNYRIVIPEECVADRSQISHKINLFDIDMKYADIQPLTKILKQLEK